MVKRVNFLVKGTVKKSVSFRLKSGKHVKFAANVPTKRKKRVTFYTKWVSMASKNPTIYLDTTVLREAMKLSKPSSLKIFDFLKQRKCILEISMFSIGELYDLEKDNVFFKTQVLSGKDVKAISHIRKQRNLTPPN